MIAVQNNKPETFQIKACYMQKSHLTNDDAMSMLLKKIFAVCLLPYAVWLVLFYRYHFVDGANLFIHEAGHMVFLPLGQTLHVLGGTFWQLAFPAIAAGYFWRRRQRYESAAVCLWFGESLMYTSVYVRDAMAMALPRVGGPIHDWNWLLYRMGLLGQCQIIAVVLHGLASTVAVLSVLYMLLDAFGYCLKPSPWNSLSVTGTCEIN
jgi:hypothetical protein